MTQKILMIRNNMSFGIDSLIALLLLLALADYVFIIQTNWIL